MKRRRMIMYNKKMEEMKKIKEMKKIEELKEAEESPFAIQEFEEDEKVVEPIVIKEEIDERVICINYDIIYKDNKEASELTGVNAGAIKRCCEGETKSAGKDEDGKKLVWKYVRDM